jgi:hypothetical protein
MMSLTKTQWLVLNAATDDFENLEQIYRSVSLEFSSERYNPSDPSSFYWREAKDRVPLSQIADCIPALVDDGLLELRNTEDGGRSCAADLTYVWRAWFKITRKGRTLLEGSSYQ